METDCIARRNNSTRDDVVAIHQRTSDGFPDTVDIDGGCCHEGNDEADSCCQQSRDHQYTKPTDIQTVVSGRDPLAEILPG